MISLQEKYAHEFTKAADATLDQGPTGDYLRDREGGNLEAEITSPVLAEQEVPPLFRFSLADGPHVHDDPPTPYEGDPTAGIASGEANFWKGAGQEALAQKEKVSLFSKMAGGPGSGVQGENAKPIPASILEQSKVVRIGGRKGIMDTQPHEDRKVNVKAIKYACQDNYVPKKMQAILEKLRKGELGDKPVDLLEVDGELHVLDGHHRVMAAKVGGTKKLIARVYKGVDKKMEKSAIGVDPTAAGLLGGVLSGYQSGRSMAGGTAAHLSSYGSKSKNEEAASHLAKVTAPVGAIAGLALALKHHPKIMGVLSKHLSSHPEARQLYPGLIRFGAGTLGGMAAGAGTGALMSLRGMRREGERFSEDDMDEYSEKNAFWSAFEKQAAPGRIGLIHQKLKAAGRVAKAVIAKSPKPVSKEAKKPIAGMASAFKKMQEKKSSALEHAAELGGLGMLAYHPVKHLVTGKEEKGRGPAAMEAAGLGVLAAPTIHKVVKGVLQKHADEEMGGFGQVFVNADPVVGAESGLDGVPPETKGLAPTNDAIPKGE